MDQKAENERGGGNESTAGLAGGTEPQDTYGNPSARIWSVYMKEAIPHDKALIESWSKDMDGILIFAGLFSAIVTAFIIESYNGLMPDPNEPTIILLQQIAQHLGGSISENQTSSTPAAFTPTASSLRVNAFWFLSLCLALTCALAATLVQQWARNYLQAIQRRPAPYVQARIREYLYEGMVKFRMSAVIEGIPTLLHASVFFFFAGLVDFLYQVNRQIAWVTMTVVGACGTLYILITILPIFHRQSPFRTPLSELVWVFLRFFGLLRYRIGNKWERLVGSMWQSRETIARADRPGLKERDIHALSWTLKNLTEDKELLPFVEGIPAFCTSPADSQAMQKILIEPEARLLPRIIALFQTCDKLGGLTPAARRARSITCVNAIATLCEIFTETNPWDLLAEEKDSFVTFIKGIPEASDYDSLPMRKLLMNKKAQLLPRIIALLQTRDKAGSLASTSRRARNITCLNAIAKLCEIYSADSWDLLHTHEETLRGVIMPMAMELDQIVADAAMNARENVVKHVKNLLLLQARQDSRDIHKRHAASLNMSHASEFGWAFHMIKAWGGLVSLAEIIPNLGNKHELADTYGIGSREISFKFCPEFQDALFQYFAKHVSLSTALNPRLFNLDNHEKLERRVLTFLSATFYIADLVIDLHEADLGDDIIQAHRVHLEAKHLDNILVHSSSRLLSKFATCALIHIVASFQRKLFPLRRTVASLHRKRIFDSALIFGRAISNEDMHPIRNPPSENSQTMVIGVEERTSRLYKRLLAAERLKLTSFPDADGPKSLFLCRGHIHLLISLLVPFCILPLEDSRAILLANRAMTDMLPYLHARYSCHRDQRRLVGLCRKILNEVEKQPDLSKSPQSKSFISLLVGVLGTIGDPGLLAETIVVMNSAQLYSRSSEYASALQQLNLTTSLEPLRDASDPLDDVSPQSLQTMMRPAQTTNSNHKIHLKGRESAMSAPAALATVVSKERGEGGDEDEGDDEDYDNDEGDDISDWLRG